MPSNISGFPKPYKPNREPVNTLVGKYTASLVREGSSHQTVKQMEDAIAGFFYDHPRVSHPKQVFITDVEDWREARLALGHSYNVVRRDLCALSGFYGWLIEEGVVTDRPVCIPRYRPLQRDKQDQLQQNQVLSLHPDLHQVDEA